MRRTSQIPRFDWQSQVEAHGLTWHTHANGTPYWDESACYVFNADEVDIIEEATQNLHALCLRAVENVISNNRFAELGIPAAAVPLITRSWQEKSPSLYGRFDFAYDGVHPPMMLEYNADTPTSLLEAAVIQWYWLQAVRPDADQFNSLWESLTARWIELKSARWIGDETVYMTYYGEPLSEDHMTLACVMQETAREAGITSQCVPIKGLGWDNDQNVFVSDQNAPIRTMFKLYPWEWMWNDKYGVCLSRAYQSTRWLEPYWKMILSSKGILAILWEMSPGHPNLLEAHLGDPNGMSDFVRKPLFPREGANVAIAEGGLIMSETSGTYDTGSFVYQKLCPLPGFDGRFPVLGSWIIGDSAHGMGIRESEGPVTDNLSQFVPHYFE